MRIQRFLLAITQLGWATGLYAGVNVIRHPGISERCRLYLRDALKDHIRSGDVHATTYENLPNTFGQIAGRNVGLTIEMVLAKIETNTQSEKLKKLFATLNTDAKTDLAFCIAGRNCKVMPGFSAFHAHTSPKFDILQSDNQGLPSHITSQGTPVVSDIIFFKVPTNNRELSDFFVGFVEETSHYVDAKTLDRWVEINQRRIENGETPDPVFQKFAQAHGGTIQLPEAFVRIYMEASATENNGELYRTLGHTDTSRYLDDHAPSIHANTAEMNSASREFLAQQQITPQNMIQNFREWEKVIAETLDNAKP